MLRNRDFDKNGHLIGLPHAEILHNSLALDICNYIRQNMPAALKANHVAITQTPATNKKPNAPVPDVVVYDISSGVFNPVLFVEVCRTRRFQYEIMEMYCEFDHYKTLQEAFVLDYQKQRWSRTIRTNPTHPTRTESTNSFSQLLQLDLSQTPFTDIFNIR